MIERYYSGNYKGSFCALCDEISLPFYGIDTDYEDVNAIPYVFYFDAYGNPRIEIGGKKKRILTHDDIISRLLHNSVSRYKTICGRLWNFSSIKLLTIWGVETPKELMSFNCFKIMCDLLYKKTQINPYNAKFIFEINEDKTERDNIFPKSDGFYIYSIPVSEYISGKMSSVDDVVKEYELMEKRKKYSADPVGKWKEFDDGSGNGYLGYHLLAYMDENKEAINEGVLYNELPDDIVNALVRHTTSIGNNPAIPDIYDEPFLLKIARKRFESTKDALREIGSIDDFEDTDINSMLSKLIKKCQELEKPFKNELEKICFNYVIDLFDVPDETVELEVNLVEDIDLSKKSTILDPIDGDDDFEYDTVDDAKSTMGEVYKRRLLNSLCMGESIILSSNIDSYKEEIEKLSPELCDLYYKIIALNNYSLYTKENLGMTDRKPLQIGTFELSIGDENEKPRISSQGKIFPVLLNETIRGFLELFISHGLPSDKKTAEYVLGKSDFLKAEPWDMRLGPSLWNLFSASFNDITLNELPYLLKNISMLDVDRFNFLMKEVFAKTKKGRNIMFKICNKSKNEIQYDKFTDKMTKMRTDKSIITDEYIGFNEL